MRAEEVLAVLHRAADAVASALADQRDWGLARDGAHAGQYVHDQIADAAVLDVLGPTPLGVLSEESGPHPGTDPVTVVVDPVDGSTNASRGLPWWASSLCALDASGPWVALVVDQVSGVRYEAVRGGGARRDGVSLARTWCPPLGDALVGLDGWPPQHFGWRQFRALGAMALDLCAVADGRLDGFVHCPDDRAGPWDYLGGALVCAEAGAVVGDAYGRSLVVADHRARRTPCAAGDQALLDELKAARRRSPEV